MKTHTCLSASRLILNGLVLLSSVTFGDHSLVSGLQNNNGITFLITSCFSYLLWIHFSHDKSWSSFGMLIKIVNIFGFWMGYCIYTDTAMSMWCCCCINKHTNPICRSRQVELWEVEGLEKLMALCRTSLKQTLNKTI